MSEPGPDWDAIAGEIDDKSPARHFGDLNRIRDEGRLRRYLFLYEYTGEDGGTRIHTCWTHDEHLWAMGASRHAARVVDDSWESEGEDA